MIKIIDARACVCRLFFVPLQPILISRNAGVRTDILLFLSMLPRGGAAVGVPDDEVRAGRAVLAQQS